MALGRDLYIYIDPSFGFIFSSSFFVFFFSWREKIAIVTTMTNAKQHNTISGTVPQKDEPESKLFIIYRKQICCTCESCAQDHVVLLCCLETLEPSK